MYLCENKTNAKISQQYKIALILSIYILFYKSLFCLFQVALAQCAIYLARAPKSFEVYSAYNKARSCVIDHEGPLPAVPLHLRNASTKLMKSLGMILPCGISI